MGCLQCDWDRSGGRAAKPVLLWLYLLLMFVDIALDCVNDCGCAVDCGELPRGMYERRVRICAACPGFAQYAGAVILVGIVY